MQYMVKGADGKEYGPTDVATLKTWAAEGRLAPHSQLRDFASGQTMAASAVPGLFESAMGPSAPPVPSAYPRGGVPSPTVSNRDHGGGAFAGVVFWSIAGIVLFFVLNGIGLFVAGSSLLTAFRLQSQGSKWGIPALAVSGLAVAAIGIGWIVRLSGGHA